jgi:transcriptional regulator with XRE-family HTH domain
MTAPREPFSRLVQQRMYQAAWTPAQLARRAGTGSATVRRVLAGRDVRLSSALKIAAALSLSAGDLGQPGDLNRPAPLPGMPDLTAPPPARHEPTVRCYECTPCDKTGALVCNDPEGICHPGECEPE